MHKVTYTYTHPVDVSAAIQFTPEQLATREEFLTHAYSNGLVTVETRVIDQNTLVHEALWDSAASFDAAKTFAGAPYAAFVASVKDGLESSGGTYNVTTSVA